MNLLVCINPVVCLGNKAEGLLFKRIVPRQKCLWFDKFARQSNYQVLNIFQLLCWDLRQCKNNLSLVHHETSGPKFCSKTQDIYTITEFT